MLRPPNPSNLLKEPSSSFLIGYPVFHAHLHRALDTDDGRPAARRCGNGRRRRAHRRDPAPAHAREPTPRLRRRYSSCRGSSTRTRISSTLSCAASWKTRPSSPGFRALTAAKANFTRDDWLVSAKLGALECLAAGITTIGDNTDSGVSLQAALETGLRGIVYQELFGIDPREPVAPILADLKAKMAAHRKIATDPGSGRRLASCSLHHPSRVVRRPAGVLRRRAASRQHPCRGVARRKRFDRARNGAVRRDVRPPRDSLDSSHGDADTVRRRPGYAWTKDAGRPLRPSDGRRQYACGNVGRERYPLPEEQREARRGHRAFAPLAGDGGSSSSGSAPTVPSPTTRTISSRRCASAS